MSGDALSVLQDLNARFINNFVMSDVDAHEAIIHERFTCIMPTGERFERKQYLTYWAIAFNPSITPYYDYRDERISVFGNIGLVSATTKSIRVKNGVETTGMTFYTDTYLLEDGIWRCVQAQLTTVQPQHFPSDETIQRVYIRGRLQKQPAAAAE